MRERERIGERASLKGKALSFDFKDTALGHPRQRTQAWQHSKTNQQLTTDNNSGWSGTRTFSVFFHIFRVCATSWQWYSLDRGAGHLLVQVKILAFSFLALVLPRLGTLPAEASWTPSLKGAVGHKVTPSPTPVGSSHPGTSPPQASKAWLLPWVSSIPEELSQLQSSSGIGPGQGSYGTAAQPPSPPNPASLPPSQVLFLAC